MHNIRQRQGETLMNWADIAYQTCARDNPLALEAELDRLASWIFTELLLDGEITKELSRQTYVGLAVIVGKSLDLRLNIPATNDDNDDDDDCWSTTATVGVHATREMATQTEMDEVHLNPQKMRRAIEHLIRGQEVIVGDQQSQSRARVICNRCGQEVHNCRGCAK